MFSKIAIKIVCHGFFMQAVRQTKAQDLVNGKTVFNAARSDNVKRNSGHPGVTSHISLKSSRVAHAHRPRLS